VKTGPPLPKTHNIFPFFIFFGPLVVATRRLVLPLQQPAYRSCTGECDEQFVPRASGVALAAGAPVGAGVDGSAGTEAVSSF
jgi:hypothetical protein